MSRKQARELLMKMVFQMDAQQDASPQLMRRLYDEQPVKPKDKDYIEQTFANICLHREEIDAKISANSRRWKLERIPKADLAILRVGVGELFWPAEEGISPGVAINEAVELAKIYGTDQAPSFINGILGNIARNRDKE